MAEDWAVMVIITEGYDDFFQNWLNHFFQLKLNMKVFVIAEDEYIYRKYINESRFILKRCQFKEVNVLL